MMPQDQSVTAGRSSPREGRSKKMRNQNECPLPNSTAVQWKSDAQQQIYSSKLVDALQKVRLSEPRASPPQTSRVRDAASRALATTAKGSSRWSRAILTNRLKRKKLMKKTNDMKRQRTGMTIITTGNTRWVKKSKLSVPRLKSKGLAAFQCKARSLGRLIPGCRKQPVQVVLQEALDYIPALEMQVRAMSALVARLTTVPGDGRQA